MGSKPRRHSTKETAAVAQEQAVESLTNPPAEPSEPVETPPEPDATVVEPEVPSEFVDEESKSIAWAKYDADKQTLIVSFKGSGGVKYGYGNIDLEQWLGFYQASSRGAYFNQFIRPMAAGKLL